MENKKKFTKLQYETAIRQHGFKSVVSFCKHYDLNNSTVSKIINGYGTWCGQEYLEKFHALIIDELQHAASFHSNSTLSSKKDQADVA